MSKGLGSLFEIPSALLEAGLVMAQSAMKNAQGAIDKFTGHQNGVVKGAPVNGPADLDLAVADFATRLMRVYRYSPRELAHLPTASADILAAAKESFRNLDLKDPRNLAFPVQLALSVGTLFTESAL